MIWIHLAQSKRNGGICVYVVYLWVPREAENFKTSQATISF